MVSKFNPLLVLGALALVYTLTQTDLLEAGACVDVFCNDFEFICCGEETNTIVTYDTGADYYTMMAYQCPTSALRCDVGIEGDTLYTVNNENCWRFLAVGGTYRWKCDNEQYLALGGTITINGGGLVWSPSILVGRTLTNIKEYSPRLGWCGTSACSAGETGLPVLGADGCSFDPDSRTYDAYGNLVNQDSSWEAVPLTECYLSQAGRHVCGNTCEECTSNSDCVAGHTYTYQGQGAECSTGRLELYGCRLANTYREYDFLIGRLNVSQGGLYPNNRCEVVETITVQCCPYTESCGVGFFCDDETFTCQQSVECTQDWECGVAQTCDRNSMTIEKPVCSAGACTTETVRSVDCCVDNDCPVDYFCDTDYTCKEKSPYKTDCPFECCVNEELYYNKNCAEGICVDNQCSGINLCGNGVCDSGETPYNCPSDCVVEDCYTDCQKDLFGVTYTDPLCLLDCYLQKILVWGGKVATSLVVGVIASLITLIAISKKRMGGKKLRDARNFALLVGVVVFAFTYTML